MLSIAVFLLTSVVVVAIARAFVSGRDPGIAMTLMIGGAAQVVAAFATFMIGLGQSAQPWSFIGAIALASVILSFVGEPTEAPRPPIEVPPCDPGVVLPPSLQPRVPRPPKVSLWSHLPKAGALAATGALLMGVTGFLIGFFGPIKFQPWANQGPMVGIFLTGPGGVLLGAFVGIVLGVVHPEWSARRRFWILNAANVAWGLFVLTLVMDRTKWN